MNLEKLFKLQKELDEHIEMKHPRKEGEDRLSKKILALQVELAECAQESRCFKYWSDDQEPRTKCVRWEDAYTKDNEIVVKKYSNPLLEEYVDCLHFILSIGNDLNMSDDVIINFRGFKGLKSSNLVRQFNEITYFVSRMPIDKDDYYDATMEFLDLGEMLGFTWEQIEQAYFEKNKINHERQNNSY